MKRFEHMKVKFSKLVREHSQQLDVQKLNALGDEGWEFIGIVSGECVFKRENTR